MDIGQQFANLNIDPTVRTGVRRLRNIYEATPDEVREAGMNWYGNVHEAAMKALEPGRTIRHAAGVVAAVSPNMDWEKNNIGAFDEIRGLSPEQWSIIQHSSGQANRTDEAKDALKGLSISTAGDRALLNARRIWVNGEDFTDVLPRRTAPKTNSFAHNIAYPDQAGPVTVDGRHSDMIVDSMRPWQRGRGIGSADLVRGDRSRYEDYEHMTRLAAARYGILPHQLQAVTWEMGKRIERNFNPNRKQGDTRRGQSYQGRLASFMGGAQG